MTGNLWVKVISPVRQFCEKANSFIAMPSKNGKIRVLLSFSLVYISLVRSVTIANVQVEWN